MPQRVLGRPGRWSPGGVLTFGADRLYEELSYVAYHFHWSLDALLDLEHPVRRRFVDEIASINRRASKDG